MFCPGRYRCFPNLRFRTLTFALFIAWLPSLAAAVEVDAAADGKPIESSATTLEAVVVTAEKRETNLQKTPISVSVIGSDELADRHVVSLGDLADGSIPSLRVAPFATRSSALNISIRGIGASGDANQPARDAGVGVYVDGVFLGRSQGLGAALLDVEHIEVLKGPQGTLFGRNTEGGAISIVTKKPTGIFGLTATGGVSSYGGYESVMHLDLPRLDNFSFKFDGLLSSRDGTTTNPMRGQKDFNGYDKRGVRFTTLWQPSDRFEATYAYDDSFDATTPYQAQLLVAGPYASPLQVAGASLQRVGSSILGGPQRDSIGKTSGHLLIADWTPSENLQVKSITSYRELSQGQFDQGFIDAISTYTVPYGQFGRYSLAQVQQHQYSQELQLIGSTDTVSYVGGAFYYHEIAADNAQTPLTNQWNANGSGYTFINTPLDLDNIPVDRASRARTDSLGIFGQATWTPEAMDRLHVTGGGRWTRDEKNGALLTLNGKPSNLKFDGSWSRFDPMVNVAFDLGRDAMVYAKYSTGFKAGGANSRSFSYRAFGPEEVVAYELGFKSQFWRDRGRFNLALFDSTIKDKQMDFFLPLAVGQTRTVSNTTNAGSDGKSRGAEIEFSVMPVSNLTVSLNYAYTIADAIKAPNPYTESSQLVTVLPLYAPRNAGSVGIDYLVPIDASAVRFHLDGNWSDGFYTSETEQTATDKSFVVNGRIALVDVAINRTGATAEFSVWARNLFNEQHLFYKSRSASLGTYGIFNDPRTFGIEATVHF